MRLFLLSAAAGLLVFMGPVFLCASFAAAQGVPCDDHAKAQALLEEKYREAPVARGLDARGNMVEVYATKDGATWSILMTAPHGLACMIAAGQNWRSAKQKEPGEGT